MLTSECVRSIQNGSFWEKFENLIKLDPTYKSTPFNKIRSMRPEYSAIQSVGFCFQILSIIKGSWIQS